MASMKKPSILIGFFTAGIVLVSVVGYLSVTGNDVPEGPLICETDAWALKSPLFAVPLTDAAVTDLSGKPVMFHDLKGTAMTVVVFCSYKCPCSDGYTGRLDTLRRKFEPHGVSFVALHSNADETASGMKSYVVKKNYPLPVYQDNGHVVADLTQATITPEVFVFTPDWILQYHGRIDDDKSGLFITDRSLESALDTLLAGKELVVKEKLTLGCSITRNPG